MQPFTSSDPKYQLWALLAQTRRALLNVRQRELKPYGISAKKSGLIRAVEAMTDRTATPAEISRWLFREPHTVSELVTRMERQGLVSRAKDPSSKKLVRVSITEKGREICNQSKNLVSIPRILSCLSEEEQQQLRSYLFRLRAEAMKELGVKFKLPYPPSE
jgi:DNA-binding MarR family transcriptional regulator